MAIGPVQLIVLGFNHPDFHGEVITELQRLRDIYLEPFGRGPEIADIAYRVGTVARGIAWDRMVFAREPEFVDEDDLTGPAYGIKLFLAGGPIGTWQEP